MGPKRKRYESYENSSFQLDPSYKEKVQTLFEKKFTYSSPDDIPWPSLEISVGESWIVEELVKLKTDLNCLKDRLSDKDVYSWHKHTCQTNIAGAVISELRSVYHVEMCTQAWSKCYEILSLFNVVNLDGTELNSVHLCEAPGAFIAALNHFLKTQGFDWKWQWKATTLNPYYEGNSLGQMINDDRFIRGTMDNWYFGSDNTGDLMKPQNLDGLQRKAEGMGKIHLVTADGSIDCQSNPAEQEQVVSGLHWFEVLACLQILTPGGSFIIKLFTMFEASSICLMYLLNSCFRQVCVFKPATSKSGNSEVYVICQDYKRLDCTFMNTLRQVLLSNEDNTFCIFKKDEIPADFIHQHIRCCSQFYKFQCETIENNLSLFNCMTEEYTRRLDGMREYCTELFVNKYNIRNIPRYLKIIRYPTKQNPERFILNKPKQSAEDKTKYQMFSNVQQGKYWKYSGSFQDRLQQKKLPWKQQIQQMEPYNFRVEYSMSLECQQVLTINEVNKWRYSTGQRVCNIQSSRFCDARLVEHMNELLTNSKVTEVENTDNLHKCLVAELTRCLRLTVKEAKTVYCCEIDEEARQLLQDEFHGLKTFEKLASCSELESIDRSSAVCVVCNSLVQSSLPGSAELSSQCKLLKYLAALLEHLPLRSDVLIIISSAYTRFTAGLLYILATSFLHVSISQEPGDMSFQQVLALSNFQGIPKNLSRYLRHVQSKIEDVGQSDSAILEAIPTSCIISDHIFSEWLLSVNRSLTVNFINAVIEHEKKLLE